MSLSFVIKKIVFGLGSLFLVLTLVFFLMRLAPGSPFDTERVLPAEVQKNLNIKYGLHLPVIDQYLSWLGKTLAFQLDESFHYRGKQVSEILVTAIWPSVILGAISLFIAFSVGTIAGILSFRFPWLKLANITLLSIPSFFLASILVAVFSLWLGVLPPALLLGPTSYILPSVALAARPIGMISQLVASELASIEGHDFIRTARAKGLKEWIVISKHALKNSLIPLTGILSPLVANTLTGSIVIEFIFQLPGVGRYFVFSVVNRDYPLVVGVTLIYGLLLISMTIVADSLAALIDPRIKFEDT